MSQTFNFVLCFKSSNLNIVYVSFLNFLNSLVYIGNHNQCIRLFNKTNKKGHPISPTKQSETNINKPILNVISTDKQFNAIRKASEYAYSLNRIHVTLHETTSTSVTDSVRNNLQYMQRHIENIEGITICECIGLEINGMRNFPGALLEQYHSCIQNQGITSRHGSTKAIVHSAIGLIIDGQQHPPIVHKLYGKIALSTSSQVEWEACFIPDLLNTPFYTYNGLTLKRLEDINIAEQFSHTHGSIMEMIKYCKQIQPRANLRDPVIPINMTKNMVYKLRHKTRNGPQQCL